MTTALVVSGGGSKGAFAIGAIERLYEEPGITFDVIAGSSTGALIAPLVVTDEIPRLRALYSRVRTEDILTQRAVFDIITHDAIYDSNPLWSLINTEITEQRYEQIVAAPKEIYLTTVNLQSGQVEYWNQHHNGPIGQPAPPGPLPRQTFMRAMLASASQPVLMPNVRLIENGNQYVDGGVREVAPLKIAIDQGATSIYAIVLSPETAPPSPDTYLFVVKTLLRTIDLFVQEVTVNDVHTARLVNRTLRYLEQARQDAARLLSPAQVATIFDAPHNPNPFAGKHLLELQVIRPAETLPSDGLEFDPFVMSQMMTMGREAAEEALQRGPSIV